MVPPPFPHDFKEFLKLLNEHEVRYLVIGGHAVGMHGYVRYTGDLDIWIAADTENAARVTAALRAFGFDLPSLSPDLFERERQIVRMGVPPLRIEIHTSISGVSFAECTARRHLVDIQGVAVPAIGLEDLKVNKAASGRLKDMLDLENLP